MSPSTKITPDLPRFDRYTVIGVQAWGERYAEVYQTDTAAEAERLCPVEIVAGVLGGAHAVDPDTVLAEPAPWTVVAYYLDNDQRYATSVEALTAAEAEALAIAECRTDNRWTEEDGYEGDEAVIAVCGVVLGQHACQDVYESATDEGAIWRRPGAEDLAYERARRGL